MAAVEEIECSLTTYLGRLIKNDGNDSF